MSTVRYRPMTQLRHRSALTRVDTGLSASQTLARFGRYLRPMESGSRFSLARDDAAITTISTAGTSVAARKREKGIRQCGGPTSCRRDPRRDS